MAAPDFTSLTATLDFGTTAAAILAVAVIGITVRLVWLGVSWVRYALAEVAGIKAEDRATMERMEAYYKERG